MKYFYYGLFVGVLIIITSCSHGKTSDQLVLENLSQEEMVPEEESSDIMDVIRIAESHYDEGCEHYKQHRWALARQSFDKTLETLLDADVDAETHYKLSRTYDRLFYKIHKLELEQGYLQAVVEEEVQEEAESTAQLEAFLSSTQSELSAIEQEKSERTIFENSDKTLGAIVIDESDATVMKYVKDFSRERSQYRKGMERAAYYLPMMLEVFKAHNIPTELTYVPLVESNFRVDAVSPAGAVGLWQFVRSTAKCYGLRVDSWVDERRDPEKATEAAAKYLSDLYDMLGDWDLALSGYYMGEYKVHKAIGKHRTRDISTLAETRTFGNGAKHYVSRIKAAIILAKDPGKHGIPPLQFAPIQYDTVNVKKGSGLKELARKFGISYTELRKLNPELKQSKIPPGTGNYSLKVPQGTGTIMIAGASGAQESSAQKQSSSSEAKTTPEKKTSSPSTDYWVYKVKRGENLTKIAKRYGIPLNVLKDMNNIKNARSLQIGQKLKIPSSEKVYASSVIMHRVQKGETLGGLAGRYKVSVAKIKTYNNIKDANQVRIGQKLKIPLSSSSVLAKNSDKSKMLTYRVRRGDSLSKIASAFGVSVSQLRRWNGFEPGAIIYPGSRIKVWY